MRHIFVVCTNPENGEHIAFDAANPIQCVAEYSKERAIATFVCEFMGDVVEVLEPGQVYSVRFPEDGRLGREGDPRI